MALKATMTKRLSVPEEKDMDTAQLQPGNRELMREAATALRARGQSGILQVMEAQRLLLATRPVERPRRGPVDWMRRTAGLDKDTPEEALARTLVDENTRIDLPTISMISKEAVAVAYAHLGNSSAVADALQGGLKGTVGDSSVTDRIVRWCCREESARALELGRKILRTGKGTVEGADTVLEILSDKDPAQAWGFVKEWLQASGASSQTHVHGLQIVRAAVKKGDRGGAATIAREVAQRHLPEEREERARTLAAVAMHLAPEHRGERDALLSELDQGIVAGSYTRETRKDVQASLCHARRSNGAGDEKLFETLDNWSRDDVMTSRETKLALALTAPEATRADLYLNLLMESSINLDTAVLQHESGWREDDHAMGGHDIELAWLEKAPEQDLEHVQRAWRALRTMQEEITEIPLDRREPVWEAIEERIGMKGVLKHGEVHSEENAGYRSIIDKCEKASRAPDANWDEITRAVGELATIPGGGLDQGRSTGKLGKIAKRCPKDHLEARTVLFDAISARRRDNPGGRNLWEMQKEVEPPGRFTPGGRVDGARGWPAEESLDEILARHRSEMEGGEEATMAASQGPGTHETSATKAARKVAQQQETSITRGEAGPSRQDGPQR